MCRSLLVAAAIAAASPALAGPPGRSGFELHGDLGIGFARSAASKNGISQSVGGIGAMHGVGGGWGFLPGFTFGADYWGSWVYGPRVQTRGPGGGDRLTYRVWGVGPSVRWVHPSGLFAQVTPSLTRVSLSDNDENGFVWKTGFGLRLGAGKLWVADPRWTVGLSAVVLFATNAQDDVAAPRWNSLGGGLVCSFGFR
jgi:hypothetical protein